MTEVKKKNLPDRRILLSNRLIESLNKSLLILGTYCGAPARTRTADLLITNQLLYQLSYKGIKNHSYYIFKLIQIQNDTYVY